MQRWKVGAGIVGLVALGFLVQQSLAEKETRKVSHRVFELRTYYAAPGKMEALHARFRQHTNKLFMKHGMTIIGFWSPTDEREAQEKLVYLLSFPSRAAADRNWQAFREDPEWKRVKEESEKE